MEGSVTRLGIERLFSFLLMSTLQVIAVRLHFSKFGALPVDFRGIQRSEKGRAD